LLRTFLIQNFAVLQVFYCILQSQKHLCLIRKAFFRCIYEWVN